MQKYISIVNKIEQFNKSITVPGDKSISIRLVLLASQAVGKSRTYNLPNSEDINNTISSIRSLGVKIKKKKHYIEIVGVGLNGFHTKNNQIIYAGNSGTFARLFCGLVSKSETTFKIIGDKSLSRRDFSRIIIPLKLFGINFRSKNNKLPLKVVGSNYLRPIKFEEKKGSAQVKSAIMIASLNTPGETIIKCIPSRNHTELMFKHCLKVPIEIKKGGDITNISELKKAQSLK